MSYESYVIRHTRQQQILLLLLATNTNTSNSTTLLLLVIVILVLRSIRSNIFYSFLHLYIYNDYHIAHSTTYYQLLVLCVCPPMKCYPTIYHPKKHWNKLIKDNTICQDRLARDKKTIYVLKTSARKVIYDKKFQN